MVDAVRTLVGDLERELTAISGALLFPGAGADAVHRVTAAVRAAVGEDPPAGLVGWVAAHDGGRLPGGVELLSLADAAARHRDAADSAQRGLWPVMVRGGRVYALDPDGAASDGEWPVVEITERGADRMGTSLLRFLLTVAAELAMDKPGEPAAPRALASERCRRDPGHADHWLELAQLQEEAGDEAAVDATLASAVRMATPPTPALLFAIGMRAALQANWSAAARAFEDAVALEPLTTRDDDARLDAAACAFVLASDRGDAASVAAARRVLSDGLAATVAFWRVEALHALGAEGVDADRPEIRLRADLGLRVVAALAPTDPDLARLRRLTDSERAGLRALRRSRDALEAGRPDEAIREGRRAVEVLPELGAGWALLAEALNANRDAAALEAARRATMLNPLLVEGWRELGEAELEAGDLSPAERAFRKLVELDPTYGLGFAKLAQVLLEQGRSLEALEAIGMAAERGGDPFFVAAIRGDIYSEMERHSEAAEAYDQALKIDPHDHWALHQAAIEHGHAGHVDRATELFEAALEHDRDGCHQTLVDFGDLLRRSGRIGDAVRLYRKAVAAVPQDPEWKQTLKEAERELLAAPN